jgi:hypothetical protein
MQTLPLEGAEFSGKDVPLTDFEKTFFNNVNVIKRLYRIDGNNYFVTVLDGTRNRHVVHDPYYCFRGSGWEIMSAQDFPLKNGEAKLIEITKGAQQKNALFWFSNQKEQYTSPWKYWWEILVGIHLAPYFPWKIRSRTGTCIGTAFGQYDGCRLAKNC